MGEQLYNQAGAAEYLGVSLRTVTRYIERGEFPAPTVFVGRRGFWTATDLEAVRGKIEYNQRFSPA